MKPLIGATILAATLVLGGVFAMSPAAAAPLQSNQPVAQHEQAAPLTDVSAQRRYRRHRHYHRHWRHRHYRPYYYGPRYYYRPYYYAPRPYFGFGFGFGPRYYW